MEAARRNVLLVSFDDAAAYQDYRNVFGETLRTPNLDRICAQSAAFRAAYCQAPICGPSRASMMTGLSPHQLGVLDHSTEVFDVIGPEGIWSSRLKAAGFYCSSGGKVHHRYKPLPTAYHRALYNDGPKTFRSDMKMLPDIDKKKYGGNRGGWGTTDPKDDATYHDHQSADSFIDFIESYDRDAPFYREVGFYSPHGPHYTPARFKEMYDADAFRPPAEWAAGFDPHPFTDERMPQNPKLGKPRWWRESVRNYFSALSHGDHHLGRVWDALKASRHADNTVVVIVSDHGFHLGNRNRFRKATLWEQAAKVPLILHDPSRPEAREIHDPVALLDVGPTVLDHAGLPGLPGCAGRSLRGYLDGDRDPDRAVPTFYDGSIGIRRGDYRFILYADGSTQLFDLASDYWQLRDLGPGHPAFAPMLEALVASAAEHGLDIEP
ncbi:sulfatase-like hydrolase/transferase [Oceaniglobus roseus]|uniref:sulfatase-like hydrolase/transferase n=1 Tax=Oceaniglobus roseus TaxID=1737570 RepID=UPI001300039E|nr:sulfatase-like hydrolase/transferase [Kandeliimicrobium roseum]